MGNSFLVSTCKELVLLLPTDVCLSNWGCAVQDLSQQGRRLQQSEAAADAHVRLQAADGTGAIATKAQLQDAVSSGRLAVSMTLRHEIPHPALQVSSILTKSQRGTFTALA